MRRVFGGVLAIALVAGGIYLGYRWATGDGADGASGGGPSAGAGPTAGGGSSKPGTNPSPPAAGIPARPKNAQPMKARYVYDGDTLQLQAAKPGAFVNITGKVDVRILGVDTPEMHPAKECYAQQATDFLRKLLPEGSTVWVVPDKESWDDYKRRLFYLWTDDGRFVNYEIVAGGYGPAVRIWPNVAHFDQLKAAEKAAQKAKKGLWGTC